MSSELYNLNPNLRTGSYVGQSNILPSPNTDPTSFLIILIFVTYSNVSPDNADAPLSVQV